MFITEDTVPNKIVSSIPSDKKFEREFSHQDSGTGKLMPNFLNTSLPLDINLKSQKFFQVYHTWDFRVQNRY